MYPPGDDRADSPYLWLMNVRLLVLGLLRRQPMHGYELNRLAVEHRIESWSGVLPGSVYHALKGLERDGLIAPARDQSGGSRGRVVYGITAAGRKALVELARAAFAEPIRSFPTDLYGGLIHADQIPPAEVDALSGRQIEELEAEIARWTEARPMKGPLAPEVDALYQNGLDHLELDLALLRRLRVRRRRKPNLAR
jgi:DNA-binding PadR family transcriptional regulator